MEKRILLIDDEDNFIELLKCRLEANEYLVDVAYDGKEGLRKIHAHRPNLVIADIKMPIIDGFELCKIMKSNDNLKDIPIIILSAFSQDTEEAKMKECGATCFIPKPFDPEYLLSVVERFIL